MIDHSELIEAIRREREAEKALEECRRRTNELAGLVEDREQRRKKPSNTRDFSKACGIL